MSLLEPTWPWGNICPPLAPAGLHCPFCLRTDPGSLCRGRGKGTGCLLPPGAELTHKPSPFLHPEPPHSVPWLSAISSGHEMWHSVTHASPGAEPSDTRPPGSHGDMQSVRVWCALEILVCWRLSAAGAGQLPSPARRLPRPSRAPLPQPRSTLLPQSFHQSSFSPAVTQRLFSRGEKSRKITFLVTFQLPDPAMRPSPTSAASSLASAGQDPSVQPSVAWPQLFCPSHLLCKQQRKHAGAGSC